MDGGVVEAGARQWDRTVTKIPSVVDVRRDGRSVQCFKVDIETVDGSGNKVGQGTQRSAQLTAIQCIQGNGRDAQRVSQQ